MVTEAGRVSTSRRRGRSGATVSVLLFAYAVMSACGGRSALVDDALVEGEGGEAADGGTLGVGGSYATGGKSGAQGGSYGNAGTFGTGGTYGKAGTFGTGGYGKGGTFGTGAVAAYAGFAGTSYGGFGGYAGAGIAGTAFGGFAGSGTAGQYGGFGGTFAGFGGSVAGYGGSIYPAGASGTYGKGGYGGKGGAPDLSTSCASACKNMSPVCLQNSTVDDCYLSCLETGYSTPECTQPFSSYAYCVGSRMWPEASCYWDGNNCYGTGCLSEAMASCAPYLEQWVNCTDGNQCRFAGSTYTGNYCQLLTSCSSAFYQTDCYATDTSGAGYWNCYCYAEGALYAGTTVAPSGSETCYTAASICGVPPTY